MGQRVNDTFGSWVKWVSDIGWITWITGQSSWPKNP